MTEGGCFFAHLGACFLSIRSPCEARGFKDWENEALKCSWIQFPISLSLSFFPPLLNQTVQKDVLFHFQTTNFCKDKRQPEARVILYNS